MYLYKNKEKSGPYNEYILRKYYNKEDPFFVEISPGETTLIINGVYAVEKGFAGFFTVITGDLLVSEENKIFEGVECNNLFLPYFLGNRHVGNPFYHNSMYLEPVPGRL